MKLYSGIDLHSSNNYIGIIDENDKRIYKRKLPNELKAILGIMEPFKEDIVGVAVESTYNWYWLVDGLMAHGYKVHLANPSAIKQYEGLKHIDDQWDSFWLAHLLRLGILPQGYIYPKEQRPIRDLLRKRLQLVRHRTAHILSVENLLSRNLGIKVRSNTVKGLDEDDIRRLFPEEHLFLAVNTSIKTMRFLQSQIKGIEGVVKSKIKVLKEFESLLSVPGIGDILGLTIMLETGDIRRFAKVGNYSSYCRCVKSQRISNNKIKGKGNSKNGNRYLAWAYLEAANFAIRYCQHARSFYQRKMAKSNNVVAIKALSHKLARASYYIIRDQTHYDARKLFG
jgi:transposase